MSLISCHSDIDIDIEQIDRKFAINTQIETEENTKINCDCNICYETFNVTNFVKLNCGHDFCKDCIKKTLRLCSLAKEPICAFCRAPISQITYKNEEVLTEFSDMFM